MRQTDDVDLAWTPSISKKAGPVYLAIADALEADIASGRLAVGARLPPQRTLAGALGIDFTTVTRAYAEARQRGLVEGRVGQGTYVRARSAPPAGGDDGMLDMSMNMPPRFRDAPLNTRMWRDIAGLETAGGLDLMLRYQEAGGTATYRLAGTKWLSERLAGITPDRVLVAPGAQGALLAVAGALTSPGDGVLADPLTYPGFLALAAHLRLRLLAAPNDDQGPIPEAFERLCEAARPKAYYCNPTIQNPTTLTIPLARRKQIVAIARKHGVMLIEDDAYGALPTNPVPPFAAIAPDMVYHIAGLAKCIAPALRLAYLATPDARAAERLAGIIRATASMASPLTAAIATRWIEDGTAGAIRDAIRAEAKARQAIAACILPRECMRTDPEGFHIWLNLPTPWKRADFVSRLRSIGVSVVAADAFALGDAPEAVRLGLGAAGGRELLAQSLQRVGDLLVQPAKGAAMVV